MNETTTATRKSRKPEDDEMQNLADLLQAQGVRCEPGEDDSDLLIKFPVSRFSRSWYLPIQRHREHLAAWLRRDLQQHPWLPLSAGEITSYRQFRQDPADSSQNIGVAVRLSAAPDRKALGLAIQAVVNQHPMLRARYRWTAEQPERSTPARNIALTEIDASALDGHALLEAVHRALHEPFDPDSGLVFRVHLFSQSEQHHVLLLSGHHIALDGLSLLSVLDDLHRCCGAQDQDSGLLAGLKSDYDEFVSWQRAYLASPEAEADRAYWRNTLHPLPSVRPLAAQAPEMAMAGHVEGDSVAFELPDPTAALVREACRRHQVTPYLFLLATWAVLMRQFLGQDDIVVGTPVAGRPGSRFRKVTGFFANIIPIRMTAGHDHTFGRLLAEVSERVAAGQKHGGLPYSRLIEQLDLPIGRDGQSLVRTTFMLMRPRGELMRQSRRSGGETFSFGGMSAAWVTVPQQEALFDVSLELIELNTGISGYLKYRRGRFSPGSARQLAAHFVQLAAYLSRHDDAALSLAPELGLRCVDPDRINQGPLVQQAGAVLRDGLHTSTEHRLAAVWRDLLRIDVINRSDSFFESGGHSLLAIQLLSRVHHEFGVEIPLREFFDAPTISAVGRRIDLAVTAGST